MISVFLPTHVLIVELMAAILLIVLVMTPMLIEAQFTTVLPFCANYECINHDDCCSNTHCLTTPNADGRCVPLHDQIIGGLCTSSPTNSQVPKQSECREGAHCRSLGLKENVSIGICIDLAKRRDIFLSKQGDQCKSSIDCHMPDVCCKEIIHGRTAKIKYECDEYDSLLLECIFN